MKLPVIATLGSHSALDICRGANDLGFKTLVIAEKGRDQTYSKYYKTANHLGCVDECLVLDKFSDILNLSRKNTIFVPHRSFEAYLNFDYPAIENQFKIPIFGNKFLLKIEERTSRPNQYDLLDKAGIRYPKHFSNPKTIDKIAIVKISEKLRSFERAFFLVKNFTDYQNKSQELIKSDKITAKALKTAVIEEFVLGAHVNFNFFYSPLAKRLELIGTDCRRQTNLDGLLRLPAVLQTETLKLHSLTFEEAGHIAVTVLESLLDKAFALGEAFVKASQKLYPPGIIGPFALQSIITSGPPKKDIVVIDVSPRMPGSPGISATPYSNYLYGHSLSMGQRIAQEIKSAIKLRSLDKIVT